MILELKNCQKAAGNVRWIENGERLKSRNRTWGRFLAMKERPRPADSAIVTAEDLAETLNESRGKFVNDKTAIGGRAVKLLPTHYGWTLRFDTRSLAYDPDVKYRVRVHVKVDKTPDGKGEAFWAGVYDDARRENCGTISVKAEKVADGWQWYDVATWKPEPRQHFWFGPGRFKGAESPAHNGVYVDAIEISRCESK